MEKNHISKEKEIIIESILHSKKVRAGQLINYEEFLELYEPYKDKISEKYFSSILGINPSNYRHMKTEKRKVTILKSKKVKIEDKRKEQIINQLLESNKIEPKESISYEKFLELYEDYKYEMSEMDFASILKISRVSYNSLKYVGKKARVLKNNKDIIPDEDRERIISELIRKNNLRYGQSISYTEFLELYDKYKEIMTEKNFASILEISYDNLKNIKNKGNRAKILKSYIKEISEEEKQIILEELESSGKVTYGKLINYADFIELYNSYKDIIKESKFAELLGISYDSWLAMKNKGARAKLKKNKTKIDEIKYLISKEPRYYSKDELEDIAKRYNLDLDSVLIEICFNGKNVYLKQYKEILEEKGKLYIGEIGLSKKFSSKYSKNILETADIASRIHCSYYGCLHMREDIASESLVYVLKKCGDIEKNFTGRDEDIKKLLYIRISSYIKYRAIKEINKPREFSFHRIFISRKNEVKEFNFFDIGIEDKTEKVENDVLEKIIREESKEENIEERWINMLLKNIELGMTQEEALKFVSKELDISEEKLLLNLQKYMMETKKAKKTKDERFIVGDAEDEQR